MSTVTIYSDFSMVSADPSVTTRQARLASLGGGIVAVLFVLVSLGGLFTPAYSRETANWETQAIAQDTFDLAVAVPILAIAALAAAGGSLAGTIALAGALLFAVYTFAIYAFAIHLNPLFLLYCAGLGVATYALFGTAVVLWRERSRLRASIALPKRAIGGFLVGVGTVFAALWLAQLVPAARSGEPPRELLETGLLTNPVHVIDLAFVLPAFVIAGVTLWRNHVAGVLLAAVLLAFSTLMAASIALLGIFQGAVAIAIATGVLAALSLALAIVVVRSLRLMEPR